MIRYSLLQNGNLVKNLRPMVVFAALTALPLFEPVGMARAASKPAAAEPAISLPNFASASIKLSTVNLRQRKPGIVATPGGEVRAESLTLGALMWYAFDVQPYQIVGGPEWIHRDLFDVVAYPPASLRTASFNASSPSNPLSDQQRLMLQALLIERFHLAFHRDLKPGQIYVLMRPKVKSKLHPPKDPGATPWIGSNLGTSINGDGLVGKDVSMPILAARLSRYLERPVVDKTELKDSYDFKIVYPDNNPNSQEALEKSIVASVEELGLMLGPSTGLVSTIVVDGAEKPPAN